MRTIEKNIYDLCNQVDYWKDQAEYWQNKYENERDDYMKQLNQNIEQTKEGVRNALMFAFACSESEDGSLVISKDKRQELAESLKQD